MRVHFAPRQIKVLSRLVEGMTNKEIAESMGTTEQTIKNYMKQCFDKTGMSNRLELAMWYTVYGEETNETLVTDVLAGVCC